MTISIKYSFLNKNYNTVYNVNMSTTIKINGHLYELVIAFYLLCVIIANMQIRHKGRIYILNFEMNSAHF
jgi:hypothetical protein